MNDIYRAHESDFTTRGLLGMIDAAALLPPPAIGDVVPSQGREVTRSECASEPPITVDS